MNIEEFLSNDNIFDFPTVPTGSSSTAGEFFQKAIITPQNTETIRKWHHLLTRYMNDPEAIILSRLYESNKLNGDWNNRRGMLTRMADGFSYACASNDFARIIFTMAYCDFVPEYRDFKKMMTERKFSLSSCRGLTTVERDHAAFRIKQYHTRFYTQGWYLAHIMAYKRDEYLGYPGVDIRDIITLGTKNNWKKNGNYYVRELPNTLSEEQKKIAKAQFLRFVDPINYFLVPGQGRVSVYQIGEKREIVDFIRKKYSDAFGDDYKDFMKKALVNPRDIPQESCDVLGNKRIQVSFGNNVQQPPANVQRPQQIHQPRIRREVAIADDNTKVARRIEKWANSPDSKVHRIIKAFVVESRNGKALVDNVRRRCSNPEDAAFYLDGFNACLASLKTNAGNSYGKLFVEDDGYLSIFEEVREMFDEVKDLFE